MAGNMGNEQHTIRENQEASSIYPLIIETMPLRYAILVFMKCRVDIGKALLEQVVSSHDLHIHGKSSTDRSVIRKS